MEKYYPPIHKKKEFHCIHCGVFSSQSWECLYVKTNTGYYVADNHFVFCICKHCGNWSYWFDGRMMVPSEAPVPPAHHDLPQECLPEYTEARSIVAQSPRAAAAILRLLVQKLMIIFGESGKNINDDIASLVEKGLPIQVQQALDFCRVIGNNAVHPGEIDLNDSPDVAFSLFEMINFIIEDRISRPKQIAELYGKLPQGALVAIQKRDSTPA